MGQLGQDFYRSCYSWEAWTKNTCGNPHSPTKKSVGKKKVEKVYGFKPSIIGSGSMDLSSPVVIGNTQTLYRNIPEIRYAFWNSHLG